MSDTQMDWLVSGVQKSNATWKVIGNQIMFTDLADIPSQKGQFSNSLIFTDQWIAYKASQNAFLTGIKDVSNVVILTGGERVLCPVLVDQLLPLLIWCIPVVVFSHRHSHLLRHGGLQEI